MDNRGCQFVDLTNQVERSDNDWFCFKLGKQYRVVSLKTVKSGDKF